MASKSPLDPDWEGNGKPVTFAFGGDVNFPSGSTLASRLADDPATALGPGAQQLLGGRRSLDGQPRDGLTNGTCPDPQPKQYVFYAPGRRAQRLPGWPG